MTSQPEAQQKIDYIIEHSPHDRVLLEERLASYTTKSSALLPVLYVRVNRDNEASLLELLTDLPGVTYRRAEERHMLDVEAHGLRPNRP